MKTWIGLALLAFFVIVAVSAPIISPYDPIKQELAAGLASPSLAHPFGQDKLGRDILSRIFYGTRVSLGVGFLSVGISLSIGLFIGGVSGYFGGWIDAFFMRFTDIFLAFPGILLAIAFAATLGPSLTNVIIALSIIGWVGYARIIRGQILVIREQEYIAAVYALGAGPVRIITRHFLPNVLAPVIVKATFGLSGAIVTEASLSYLGLGIQPPNSSWGALLNDGRSFLLLAPHLTLIPGVAIMLLVMALSLVGERLRDYFDVKGLGS